MDRNDHTLQRFHAVVGPAVVFSVDELQTWDGIAHSTFCQQWFRPDQARDAACARIV